MDPIQRDKEDELLHAFIRDVIAADFVPRHWDGADYKGPVVYCKGNIELQILIRSTKIILEWFPGPGGLGIIVHPWMRPV